MGRRLVRTARRLGMTEEGRTLLLQAFHAAMEPRRKSLPDDHHPDFLHPARTALILMDDAGQSDPILLATAVLAETRDRSLSAGTEAVERVSREVAVELARIPPSGREREPLLEALLALAPGPTLVAVAERLDHARHLHLRDREEWGEYHATTCAVYAPVAVRVHEELATRLEWWCASFRRRFLEAG